MSQSVIGVLRRFLPEFLRKCRDRKIPQTPAVQRAIWAIRHCRTATMGGHLYTCPDCQQRAFAWHSCNHRSCPQCGRSATREWVARELAKRIGAPYFMVTFTLPQELRGLFFGREAKAAYDLFFTAAATALREKLADPKWLGARSSGFTAILHTWNQRLHFHPHLHCIVPGAGVSADGKVVTVKNANFLVPVKVLQGAFRWHFRQLLEKQDWQVDPVVWTKDWGVHLQPFGDGGSAIKYLGVYVCKTAIGDSRIIASDRKSVSFRWKDRSDGGRSKVETISGCKFVARYLRHVLPKAMRAIRYYGYCHPAARRTRERIALHTGRPIFIGPALNEKPAPSSGSSGVPACPCCRKEMVHLRAFAPSYRQTTRGPPPAVPSS
jgi:hypothetical protein